jgi:dipeptidyl aminopeptidase/acylaminoacyl peptidase
LAGMVPEDVYELTWAGEPRVSPDGTTVAVTVTKVDRETNEYLSSIWLVPADGSGPPRRFTAGPRSNTTPRWSPDGSRIAFASNRDGGKKQVYVMPADGGEPARLTDLNEDAGELAWSPDGTRIAFSARVRDEAYEEEDDRRRRPRRIKRAQFKLDNVGWTVDRRSHIFVVPADGSGEARQLTDGDYEDFTPTWSPNGSRIAFASNREDDWDISPDGYLYLVDSGGGEPRRLTTDDGEWAHPSWSPDGSLIACYWSPGGWDHPQHTQVAVVDPESGDTRVLTRSLDRNCAPYPIVGEPLWGGDFIYFAVEDRGNTPLYRVRADGSAEPEGVVTGEFGVTGYDLAGGMGVDTRSYSDTPSELYAGDKRLTEVSKPFTEARELVAAERFTATSEDGSEVDAWLVRPAGFQEGERYPVLLNIHGGPFSQYTTKFFDENQVYAGAGYAVVFSNPRGSSGFTEAWGKAIRGPIEGGPGWGTRDYEDLMGVVDAALERFDFLDPDRFFVTGGSYGGYMTSWIVSHTDRFKAACSERAVNNLYTEFASSDIGWVLKAWSGKYPFEDPESHLKHSPVTYADAIKTPLLIMHSENDLRCHPEQGEQLFTILRLRGHEVEFVRFPAEGHELSRSGAPIHRVMRFETLLEWFDRFADHGQASRD